MFLLVFSLVLAVCSVVSSKRKSRLFSLHGGPLDGATFKAIPNNDGRYEVFYSERVRPLKESRRRYWREKQRGGPEDTLVRSLAEDKEEFTRMAIYVEREVGGYELEWLPTK